jgi:hypothetical protein
LENIMNTVNPYETLMQHIEKNRYTRGMNKGDAPLDPNRRRRDWERVVQHPDKITIHRYHTDIVTVYPDGRVVLDFDGWESSPTTRVCVTVALYLMGIRASVGSVRYKNLSQVCINLPSGTYKYYPRITLVQKDGQWVPERTVPFDARVADREKRQSLDEALKASGFKDLFPLLYVNSDSGDAAYINSPTRLQEILTNPACAEFWPSIVTAVKWIRLHHYDPKQHCIRYTYEARTVSEAWAALTKTIKRDMIKVITTDAHTI